MRWFIECVYEDLSQLKGRVECSETDLKYFAGKDEMLGIAQTCTKLPVSTFFLGIRHCYHYKIIVNLSLPVLGYMFLTFIP